MKAVDGESAAHDFRVLQIRSSDSDAPASKVALASVGQSCNWWKEDHGSPCCGVD